jgi:hypothetical protein
MTTAAQTSPAPPRARRDVTTILLAGLAGGALDFAYASAKGAVTGQGVARVWQGVASGWLGRATAIEGGTATAALGVATHFGIATVMAAAYVAGVRRLPLARRRPWSVATAYGLGLYGVMYHIVLPLRWPGAFPRWKNPESTLDVLAHVGVALAFAGVAARAEGPRLGKH